ncbi:MAG: hypothetical protein NPINA01_13710 [Nitrospinaceae bacterium]|nr:MAG: hypothetical protein NPINA01_13710 [Nitrospinaceae bacterium]
MKKVGTIFAVLVGIVILLGLLLPSQYTVTRSQIIQAPSASIHPHVNDLNKWKAWAPWKEDDPSLVVTLGNISSGVGAHQSWVGKDGKGSLTFTRSSPDKGIDYQLSFDDTYRCEASLHYDEKENDTLVTWEMKGDMDIPLFGGYFAVMMDGMAGPMFEKGLSNLKKIVEES